MMVFSTCGSVDVECFWHGLNLRLVLGRLQGSLQLSDSFIDPGCGVGADSIFQLFESIEETSCICRYIASSHFWQM